MQFAIKKVADRQLCNFRTAAGQVNSFLQAPGVNILLVEVAYPWENGHVGLFNSRICDELLDGELLLHTDEMKYVVERWRMDYNPYRPHSSLT
jgi:hypothetical protein